MRRAAGSVRHTRLREPSRAALLPSPGSPVPSPYSPARGLPREPAWFLETWLDAADRQAFLEEGWEVFTCVNDSVVLRLPAGLDDEGQPLTRATLQVTHRPGASPAEAFEVHLVGARLNERRVCEGARHGPCIQQQLGALPARALPSR